MSVNLYKKLFDGKNILIVFSDPGGAKPMLALPELCAPASICAVSDRDYPFYDNFKTSVEQYDINLSSYFKGDLDLLLTGTSYTSDIELKFLVYAQQRGISSISFVDHYTNISKRFQHGSFTAYPGKVWVQDEEAAAIAVADGFAGSRLIVMPNPYIEWLRYWKPSINRDTFMTQLGLKASDTYLLYAPDPLSNVDGLDTFGFDEQSVNTEIVQLGKAFEHIIIKAHPNQKIQKFDALLQNTHFHLAPINIDTNHLIYNSQAVLGFFSSLLLESQLLGKKVYRYIPDQAKADPFANRMVGEIIGSVEFNSLIDVNG